MRKFHFQLPLFLLLVSLAAGCKKKGDNQNIDPNKNEEFDFMSSKEGSWWRYSGRNGVSYTRYARNKDSVMQGIPYRYFERKDDAASSFQGEFFVKNDGRYMTLVDVLGNGGQFTNYLFWKEGARKGDSWNSVATLTGTPAGTVQANIETEAADDNLTLTRGSKVYTNVRHAHSNLKATLLNVSVGTMDMYFSEEVGVIRQEVDINIASVYTLQHVDSLIDYDIK